MMTIVEKVAYLKGLSDGLKLDKNSDETKLFESVIDILNDLALAVSDVEEGLDVLSEQVDAVDEDLDLLETAFYEDFEDDDCDCGCCGDYDDDEDEDVDGELYEVECPACSETIYLDESIIMDGSIECPNCGETLEFDIEFEEDEDDGE